MMIRKTLIVGLVLLLLASPVMADYECANDTHSSFSTTITVSGSDIPISYDEECNYNCSSDTGKCNPSPYESNLNYIGAVIGLPLIAFICIYFAINSNFKMTIKTTEFDPIQILGLGMAFLLIMTDVALILLTVSNQASIQSIVLGAYQTILIGFELLVVIIFVSFLLSLFEGHIIKLIDKIKRR